MKKSNNTLYNDRVNVEQIKSIISITMSGQCMCKKNKLYNYKEKERNDRVVLYLLTVKHTFTVKHTLLCVPITK